MRIAISILRGKFCQLEPSRSQKSKIRTRWPALSVEPQAIKWCDDDVAELRRVPAIRRQLDKLDAELPRDELREYGAMGRHRAGGP
jgi:hypothetical protein